MVEDPLLEALDKLTVGYIVTTVLDDGTKHYERHEALIPTLRLAIASNLGGGSQAGSAGNERIPIDADALQKYEAIERAISDRHQALVGGPSGLLPENDLRLWFAAFTQALRGSTATDDDYRYQLSALQGWVRIIEEKFSPPRRRELDQDKCPVCGFQYYIDNTDRTNPERKVALTITYREDQGLEASEASCGCCKTVWRGVLGLRALSGLLEQPDTPENGSTAAA